PHRRHPDAAHADPRHPVVPSAAQQNARQHCRDGAAGRKSVQGDEKIRNHRWPYRRWPAQSLVPDYFPSWPGDGEPAQLRLSRTGGCDGEIIRSDSPPSAAPGTDLGEGIDVESGGLSNRSVAAKDNRGMVKMNEVKTARKKSATAKGRPLVNVVGTDAAVADVLIIGAGY